MLLGLIVEYLEQYFIFSKCLINLAITIGAVIMMMVFNRKIRLAALCLDQRISHSKPQS